MLEISYLKQEDIEEVLKIDKQSFFDNWSTEELEKIINDENKTDLVLICKTQDYPNESSNNVLGFGIFRILSINQNKIISKEKKDENAEAEILRICIRKDKRNKKIGTALFAEMMAECQKRFIPKIFLEVRPSNTYAIKIYEKNEFSKINIRKKYYENPTEDAIVMMKQIIY